MKVFVPEPYEVIKKVPYTVEKHVPQPYEVVKKVPYTVEKKVEVPKPYEVIKKVPYEVKGKEFERKKLILLIKMSLL